MMATTIAVSESEASDDSISLTSTVASAKKNDYEVECILAEKKNSKGVVEYLTAWKDYPENDHSWEPRENFNTGDVLNEWTNTKIRVADGLEKPFDVKAWRKRCKAIKEEADLRRKRRRVKRLRLLKKQDPASGPGEQDANVESSGSEFAPKRFDKRIKRRSVHQELPPSSSTSSTSSTSAPPSSSASEDSDRPLISRQESETSTPNTKWTQAETIALEEGLRTLKRPGWRELLSLYGRNGTISQVLRDRNATDLYDKAKSVRQEFVDSGREPPEYLKSFSKKEYSRGSRTATLSSKIESRGQSRGQSRAVSEKTSRCPSVDSMMKELHEKQRIREVKNRENSPPQHNTNPKEIPNAARGLEKDLDTAGKTSSDKLKAHQAPKESARKVEVAALNETLRENLQAEELSLLPEKAAPYGKRTSGIEEISKDKSHRDGQPEDGACAKKPPKKSATPQIERRPESHVSSTNEMASPASMTDAQPGVTQEIAQEEMDTVRGGTAWSGTARATTARPSISDPSRQGAVESGPTRSKSLKLKPKLGQIEPKRPSVTSDITAAWNAEPKQRKSNNWATTNVDPVAGQSTKRSYKLSTQNKIFKSRREGRAPDPNHLVLIDPKTRKAPTTVAASSAKVTLSRTTPQAHQQDIAAKEAEACQGQEVEDATLNSPSEPDPLPQRIDETHEAMVEEQKAPGMGRSPSAPTLRPTTGDTTGLAQIDTFNTRSLPSSRPGPPPTAPLGPRIETNQVATMSLQEYTQRSKPSTHHLNEMVINQTRPYSSDDPSMFTLRAYSSQEQKIEAFQKFDNNSVIGDIKLGEDDQESIHVKLVGFAFEVKKLLLTIKVFPRIVDFLFKSVCLASEYKAYFQAEPSDYLGSGSIVPYHSSVLALENVAEILANNLQGGLFFAPQYTMLMYPAGASAWAFLDDHLPSVHSGTALRFVLRKPLPPVVADVHGGATARLAKIGPERYAQIKTKLQKYPIQAEDKNINIVFRDMFEIDFERLVAQNGPQKHPPTNIFFLCFIPQGCEDYEPDLVKRAALRMRTSEEHDLFIKFLQANGAEEIYSMQNIGSQEIETNGAWDYFCKHVKSGTIIFHDAFIRYDLVPRLAQHLLHGSVNVWKASLSPMHPGEKHPHLVRLFPHGGVLLLTESLILYRPREALRVLMWFRLVHINTKAPGTWKLAVRPHVREWLLDIMDAYSESGKDIFGCSIQIFADIYTEIYRLLQSPDPGVDGLMCHEWDYEIPTDEAPIVSSSSLRVLQARREWKGEGADTKPDDDNIRQNDDLLAQWFAEWAIVNTHNFRKYHIILGYTKDHPFTNTAIRAYEKGWGHIEVMTPEEAFTRHKVTAQSKLDEMETERRRKLREQLPAKKAAADKARKEEREAATLALQARMQMYRDVGATDEEILRAGRQLLSELGGTEWEIEECRVDMDKVSVARWWEESR